MLAGSGLSWRAGETHEVRAGDCLVYRPERGAHTLVAGIRAAGRAGVRRAALRRDHAPAARGRALGRSGVGRRRRSRPGTPGSGRRRPGKLKLPAEVSPRPGWIVHLDDVEPEDVDRPGRRYRCRRLGVAAGGVTSGLRHVAIAPDHHGWPRHCHASEEELFVILSGTGTVRIGDEEAPVRAGHVVSRPSGTGIAHSFRAGPGGPRVPLLRPAREQRHRLLPRLRQVLPGGRRRDRARRAARLLGRGGRAGRDPRLPSWAWPSTRAAADPLRQAEAHVLPARRPQARAGAPAWSRRCWRCWPHSPARASRMR